MGTLNEPEENYVTGYISLFRSVQTHWIYEQKRKRTKLEAWIDLLLTACHKDCEEPIGFDLIVIKRGEILTSQDSLSKKWKWDRNSVRKFLTMLHKASMIETLSTPKYTKITICNYGTYQKSLPTKGHHKLQQTNTTSSTYNNDNNVNNDNNISIVDMESPKELSLYETIVEYWLKEFRQGWTFTGQHGKSVKSIITKIKTVQHGANKESTDKSVLESFKLICTNLPDWYLDKDLPVINSKFNEILIQIKDKKNGKSITAKQHSSVEYRSV